MENLIDIKYRQINLRKFTGSKIKKVNPIRRLLLLYLTIVQRIVILYQLEIFS